VKLSDTRTGMNVRIYLIIDATVLSVDTRLRLPTEIFFKMQQECNFNFITNGWARLVTRCGWASPLLLGLPKQLQLTLSLLVYANQDDNKLLLADLLSY